MHVTAVVIREGYHQTGAQGIISDDYAGAGSHLAPSQLLWLEIAQHHEQ